MLHVFGVSVSCRILYTIVSYSYDQLPLLPFTCNYVVSVRRGFGAWDGLCYFIVAVPGPSI